MIIMKQGGEREWEGGCGGQKNDTQIGCLFILFWVLPFLGYFFVFVDVSSTGKALNQ